MLSLYNYSFISFSFFFIKSKYISSFGVNFISFSFKSFFIFSILHAVKNIFTGNVGTTNAEVKNIVKKEINYYKNKMKLDNKLQKGEITKEEYAKKIAVLGFEHGLISSVTPNDSHAMYSTTA